MNYAAFLALGILIGVGASLASMAGALNDHSAQRVFVSEFVNRYCHPEASLGEAFNMGQAAALSRVSIRSGLQPLAWAEYLKCKAESL